MIKSARLYLLFCVGLIGALLLVTFFGLSFGSVHVELSEVWGIVSGKLTGGDLSAFPDARQQIIWNIRVPRVLQGIIVGAGLSVAGILMQALTKNSLADPYVLGISHGASAGAVLNIMYGVFSFLGGFANALAASLGAILAISMTVGIATVKKKTSATYLVLAGMAVNALFSALTSFMIYYTRTGSDKVRSAMYWMMGSLSGASWDRVLYTFIVFAVCILVIATMTGGLDVLMLGEEVASTIGLDVPIFRRRVIIMTTILAGAIVSVSGTIGFIGLVIPHISRMIVGSNHSRLIPAAVLLGGIVITAFDLIARVLVAPEELPIGVVSALFGAPFFMYLIKRRGKELGGS